MKPFACSCIIAACLLIPAFSSSCPAAEMTGGLYRVELSTFDNGGAVSTGSVYWHYGAVGQTEGVGSIANSLGALYAVDVGVLARPIPEGGLCALLFICSALARERTFTGETHAGDSRDVAAMPRRIKRHEALRRS